MMPFTSGMLISRISKSGRLPSSQFLGGQARIQKMREAVSSFNISVMQRHFIIVIDNPDLLHTALSPRYISSTVCQHLIRYEVLEMPP